MNIGDLRQLSKEDLKSKLVELNKESFKLRIAKSNDSEFKQLHMIKQTRKAIARVKTLLAEGGNASKQEGVEA